MTTWISWHQKGKPFWILLQQEMMRWQWHQLDHMQIICTLLQTDNHASISPVFTGRMPFRPPNQQHQSIDGLLRHPAWNWKGPILVLALHKFVTYLLSQTFTHLLRVPDPHRVNFFGTILMSLVCQSYYTRAKRHLCSTDAFDLDVCFQFVVSRRSSVENINRELHCSSLNCSNL